MDAVHRLLHPFAQACEIATDPRVVMAGILADGLNLGLTRMAEACSVASLGQLAWTANWHIRDETYALALQRLVDQQQREPLAALFGDGLTSSSDGQFFRAGGFGRNASSLNAHYGDDPGVKFYTHLSDRYAPFHTKVIAATAGEAVHVLDSGLLYHQSDVATSRHHTDGFGDSDHVFALCSLLGFQFAPRIPDLKSRRLYSFGSASAYPSLEPSDQAGRINVALIRSHWSDVHPAGCCLHPNEYPVTASLILRQLAHTRARMWRSPRRCANWDDWNAPYLRSTGWRIRNCAAGQAVNSTKVSHATA